MCVWWEVRGEAGDEGRRKEEGGGGRRKEEGEGEG